MYIDLKFNATLLWCNIFYFGSYILRFTHQKSPRKNPYEIHNQPIRKANDCENTLCVQWIRDKMKEEIPRFSLLEGTIDNFIDEQENKNTKANTDRDTSMLKIFFVRCRFSFWLKCRHFLQLFGTKSVDVSFENFISKFLSKSFIITLFSFFS